MNKIIYSISNLPAMWGLHPLLSRRTTSLEKSFLTSAEITLGLLLITTPHTPRQSFYVRGAQKTTSRVGTRKTADRSLPADSPLPTTPRAAQLFTGYPRARVLFVTTTMKNLHTGFFLKAWTEDFGYWPKWDTFLHPGGPRVKESENFVRWMER